MKNAIFTTLIYSILVITITNSCTKKEMIGPSIEGLYGPVKVLETLNSSDKNPDFTKISNIYFTAKFSGQVSWILTLKGNNSHAAYTIKNTSNELNISNAKWEGHANTLPSFDIEPVTATLTFVNTTDTLTTEINLVGKQNIFNQGILISDFSSAAKIGTGWSKDWPLIGNTNSDYTKPDGNNYLLMSGKPWQGSPITPYVNFLKIPANQADGASPTAAYFPLVAEQSRVYFNVYVYATETPDTWLKIMFFDANGTRSMNIRPDWTGWKIISIKYSDLTLEGTGNAVGDPSKISSMQFVLLSDAVPSESVSVTSAFDHATFTIDQPFQP